MIINGDSTSVSMIGNMRKIGFLIIANIVVILLLCLLWILL